MRAICCVLTGLIILLAGCNEAQKVWGKGETPADYQEIFGNSNSARLDYFNTERIDMHLKAITELAERVRALEAENPAELAERVRKLELAQGEGLIWELDTEITKDIFDAPQDGNEPEND
jgi:hypothetical protein